MINNNMQSTQTETLSRVEGTSIDSRISSSELWDGAGIAAKTIVEQLLSTELIFSTTQISLMWAENCIQEYNLNNVTIYLCISCNKYYFHNSHGIVLNKTAITQKLSGTL